MEIKIIGNKKILLTPLNARILELDLTTSKCTESRNYYEEEVLKEIFETNIINKLTFYNKLTISIGDKYVVNGIEYTVNEIIPGEYNKYLLIDTELTKTSQFLLPFVASSGSTASSYLYNSCFYNAYLNWDKYPEYDEGFIFLCYKFFNIDGYKQLETKITSQSNFIKVIEPNSKYTVFVMEFPEKYAEVKNAVLEGKYYRGIKEHYKKMILDFYQLKNTHEVYKTIYRTSAGVKELESKLGIDIGNIDLMSKPDINKESCQL